MKLRSKKSVIFIALLCIVLGAILIAVSAAAVGFHFSRLATVQFTQTLYPINEEFHSISVSADVQNVIFTTLNDCPLPQKQELNITTPTVVSDDADGLVTDVKVIDGTLTVTRADRRPWYRRIGIFTDVEEQSITIYLPEQSYKQITAETVSGDIRMMVPYYLNVGNALFQSTSGDLLLPQLAVQEQLAAHTVSGNLFVSDTRSSFLTLDTSSGEIRLWNANVSTLHIENISADIELDNVRIEQTARLESISGDVSFRMIWAKSMEIETKSGDVEGTFGTSMTVQAASASGEIALRNAMVGEGYCFVKTVSGDIEIE